MANAMDAEAEEGGTEPARARPPVRLPAALPRALFALLGVAALIWVRELFRVLLAESAGGPEGSAAVEAVILFAEATLFIVASVTTVRAWGRTGNALETARHRATELEGQLATLEEKRRGLAQRLERREAEHEEAHRLLAYDIHNGLAQIIVSAKQHLDTFEDLWQDRTPEGQAELEKGLDRLGRAVVETRLLLATLRPGRLESLGFVSAVRTLLDGVSQSAGWEADLRVDLEGAPLPGPVESAAYRIIQEALTNAARHARASRVTVALRREPNVLRVDVTDSGVGFPAGLDAAARRGLGLVGMQERARLVGGTCHVETTGGAGTRVRVTIPLAAPGSPRDA